MAAPPQPRGSPAPGRGFLPGNSRGAAIRRGRRHAPLPRRARAGSRPPRSGAEPRRVAPTRAAPTRRSPCPWRPAGPRPAAGRSSEGRREGGRPGKRRGPPRPARSPRVRASATCPPPPGRAPRSGVGWRSRRDTNASRRPPRPRTRAARRACSRRRGPESRSGARRAPPGRMSPSVNHRRAGSRSVRARRREGGLLGPASPRAGGGTGRRR